MAKQEASVDGWRKFIDLCLDVKSPKMMDEFLKLFLTITERRTIATRVQLINALLDDRLTQREIADRFNISIAKITRGSNALKIISDDLQKFLKAHQK